MIVFGINSKFVIWGFLVKTTCFFRIPFGRQLGEYMKISTVEFASYTVSVGKALDQIGAADILSGQSKILVKPNLTKYENPAQVKIIGNFV